MDGKIFFFYCSAMETGTLKFFFIRNCTLQRAILDKDFGYIFMFVLQCEKKQNVLFAHILLL